MLSHLRFHRRDRSNPTSPVPENGPWDPAAQQPTQLVPDDGVPVPDLRPRPDDLLPFHHGHGHGQPSAPAPAAPQLPPITRVTSSDLDLGLGLGLTTFDSAPRDEKPLPRSPYNPDSGFIGGLALENYRREQLSSGRPVTEGSHENANVMSGQGRPPLVQPGRTASSFVSPTDLHKAAATGKRTPGLSVNTDFYGAQPPNVQAAPRAKKSLPFLKNPMSGLLTRRKAAHGAPDPALPLRHAAPEEPSYDPRIRGTKVHDFSAPRARKPAPVPGVSTARLTEAQVSAGAPGTTSNSEPEELSSARSPSLKDERPQSIRTSSSARSQDTLMDPPQPGGSVKSAGKPPTPGTSTKQSMASTRRPVHPSVKSLSRNISEASSRDVLSSIPRHMKSTSSRFSFDMIGAAEQEKELEERHRQRQQDKEPVSYSGPRDSRFDDFDEDGFDYDALDYDDDLEERIPGVNADLDDDDYYDEEAAMDPDNDQENFGGFAFQRSDPSSSITSPQSGHPGSIPGNAGHMVESSTSHLSLPAQLHSEVTPEHPGDDEYGPTAEHPTSALRDDTIGLGIHEGEDDGIDSAVTDVTDSVSQEQPAPAEERVLDKDDELYFNDGLIHDFDGEGDGSHFDESIFDLDDTDQFGRPIPGLFASALSRRNAAQDAQKRESDMTSRLSAQSGQAQSTAHTSLSAGPHMKQTGLGAVSEHAAPTGEDHHERQTILPSTEKDPFEAYQAALAAAAHKAAASGKFQREPSPDLPADLTVTSPSTSQSSATQVDTVGNDDFYDDNDMEFGLDDYELDDDAIIAEANASALANDSDGWYGQEFGFYAAAAQAQFPSHSSDSDNEQNQLQYGGVFTPKGVDRSTSGRMVCREPNLTPITERSEYSNRNSIMSLALPPGGSANAPIQSPGLAQLAMIADDNDISLSALMRLRSKAWGGSQASLVSSREGSPSERNGASSPSFADPSNFLGVTPGHGRKNSTYSMWSQDSAGPGSASGSPTLTVSMAGGPNSAIPSLALTGNQNTQPGLSAPMVPTSQSSSACPPVFEDEEGGSDEEEGKFAAWYASQRRPASIAATNSTLSSHRTTNYDSDAAPPPPPPKASSSTGSASHKRPIMGHRHKNSADSISYRKETEEDSGEIRWVMERRRTADSGEIELLGREVVEGGRI